MGGRGDLRENREERSGGEVRGVLIFGNYSVGVTIICSAYFSGESDPVLPFFSLLRDFSVFVTGTEEGGYVSVFHFPLMEGLLGLWSSFDAPGAPSAYVRQFVQEEMPSSLIVFFDTVNLCFRVASFA